jgi:hypothetical protein
MNGFEGLDLSALIGDPDKREAQLAALRNQQMQGQILGGSSVGGGSVSNLGRQMMTNANSQIGDLGGASGLDNLKDIVDVQSKLYKMQYGEPISPKDQFDMGNKVWGNFKPYADEFSKISNSAQAIWSALNENTPIASSTALQQYAKFLDPNSAVLSGEQQAVKESAQSLMTQFKNLYANYIGKTLPPEAIRDMRSIIQKLYAIQEAAYNRRKGAIQTQASKFGLSTEDYMLDDPTPYGFPVPEQETPTVLPRTRTKGGMGRGKTSAPDRSDEDILKQYEVQ